MSGFVNKFKGDGMNAMDAKREADNLLMFEASYERRVKAILWVDREVRALIGWIQKLNEAPGGANKTVKYGKLFDATQEAMEALSGTLVAAKKRGVVQYEGQLLMQGMHDNVTIELLKETIEDSVIPDKAAELAKHKAPPLKKGGFQAIDTTDNKCAVCTKTVYVNERLGAIGKVFHKTCFKCITCKATLSPSAFCCVNGATYCPPHYQQMFAATGGKYDAPGQTPSATPAPAEAPKLTPAPTAASKPSPAVPSGPSLADQKRRDEEDARLKRGEEDKLRREVALAKKRHDEEEARLKREDEEQQRRENEERRQKEAALVARQKEMAAKEAERQQAEALARKKQEQEEKAQRDREAREQAEREERRRKLKEEETRAREEAARKARVKEEEESRRKAAEAAERARVERERVEKERIAREESDREKARLLAEKKLQEAEALERKRKAEEERLKKEREAAEVCSCM